MSAMGHVRSAARALLAFSGGFILGYVLLMIGSVDDAQAGWADAYVERYGVMTWTPTWIDPDSWYSGGHLVLESDIRFGSTFRTSGHRESGAGPVGEGGAVYFPTYEYEFLLSRDDVALDYVRNTFRCTLPNCWLDTNFADPNNRSYAVVSGSAEDIAPYGVYYIDIYTTRGPVTSANIQHISIAGARHSDCFTGIPFCAFENYRHLYNKLREIAVNAYYPRYYGGSYVTDNTFDPCPGSWGFSAGNVDFWCAYNSGGPETPGRTTIRPKSGYWRGHAYRTVSFNSIVGDHFSVEYVVQCLTGNPCEGYLGHQIRNSGSYRDERRSPDFVIPNDGNWYVCRFDNKFRTTTDRENSIEAEASGNQLRTLLGNGRSGTQLRIDAMAIFGYSSYGDRNQDPWLDLNQCNPYVAPPRPWW